MLCIPVPAKHMLGTSSTVHYTLRTCRFVGNLHDFDSVVTDIVVLVVVVVDASVSMDVEEVAFNDVLEVCVIL